MNESKETKDENVNQTNNTTDQQQQHTTEQTNNQSDTQTLIQRLEKQANRYRAQREYYRKHRRQLKKQKDHFESLSNKLTNQLTQTHQAHTHLEEQYRNARNDIQTLTDRINHIAAGGGFPGDSDHNNNDTDSNHSNNNNNNNNSVTPQSSKDQNQNNNNNNNNNQNNNNNTNNNQNNNNNTNNNQNNNNNTNNNQNNNNTNNNNNGNNNNNNGNNNNNNGNNNINPPGPPGQPPVPPNDYNQQIQMYNPNYVIQNYTYKQAIKLAFDAHKYQKDTAFKGIVKHDNTLNQRAYEYIEHTRLWAETHLIDGTIQEWQLFKFLISNTLTGEAHQSFQTRHITYESIPGNPPIVDITTFIQYIHFRYLDADQYKYHLKKYKNFRASSNIRPQNALQLINEFERLYTRAYNAIMDTQQLEPFMQQQIISENLESTYISKWITNVCL